MENTWFVAQLNPMQTRNRYSAAARSEGCALLMLHQKAAFEAWSPFSDPSVALMLKAGHF